MGVEIERKFLVKELPDNLEKYPCHQIEQAYLNVSPAIRVRRQDDIYYMTYKGIRGSAGDGAEQTGSAYTGKAQTGSAAHLDHIAQTEYNMLLTAEAYEHLASKADGNVISKKRYLIPLNDDAFDDAILESNPELKSSIKNGDIKIELDVFEGVFEGRILAEVEFPSEEIALVYHPAEWFSKDVTGDPGYSNAHMSAETI